ncbi:MAG: hypothetical protein ACLQMS_07245 [Desulfomonilaceae bacterium]
MKKISKNDETITRKEFESVISKLRDELIVINSRSAIVPIDIDKINGPRKKDSGLSAKAALN